MREQGEELNPPWYRLAVVVTGRQRFLGAAAELGVGVYRTGGRRVPAITRLKGVRQYRRANN